MKQAKLTLRHFGGAADEGAPENGASRESSQAAERKTEQASEPETKPEAREAREAERVAKTTPAEDKEKAAEQSPEEGEEKAAEMSPEKGTEKGTDQTSEAAEVPGSSRQETAEAPSGPDTETVMRAARLAARAKAAAAAAARWEAEAQEMREAYPSFSLEQALRNDRAFGALLRAGLPVRRAYEAAHLEEIMSAAMRYAAGVAGRKAAMAVGEAAGRTRENPVLDRAVPPARKDVSSLTEKDILAIIRQVGKGEKVRF